MKQKHHSQNIRNETKIHGQFYHKVDERKNKHDSKRYPNIKGLTYIIKTIDKILMGIANFACSVLVSIMIS